MQLIRSAHVDTFCRDNLPDQDRWPQLLFTLPELTYPDRLNCASALLDPVDPARRCLLTTTQSWSYGDLRRRADQVAQVLVEDFGLVPGNRVLLRAPNTPWLVACWFGVVKAGGVVVSTMPLLRAAELAKVCALSTPSLALCEDRLLDELTATGTAVLEFSELIRRCDGKTGEFTAVDTAADDVVLLAFTSGTTGSPKATMHFHRDLLAIADTFGRHVLRAEAEDLFTGTPPLAFTFGLGGLVIFPLRVGAASLLVERASPTELAEIIAAHGVSVVFTAPTAYRAVLAAGVADKLSGVRRCVSAGEALPATVWQDFLEATGVRIIEGIGATELLHIFISAADGDIRPGATGRPVPGFEAAVLDAEGRPLPDGVPGRLAVRGPTGCRYLADERQLEYVQDGWNITGDTYLRDAEGYYWYQARSDDMIISAGYNIAPAEVEDALLAHPCVAECAVVGAPDEQRGMRVHAFVVPVPGSSPEVVALQEFVKQRIAPYKYPRTMEFVAELPRTATGKLQRFALRERVS
ncbi:AMP-binding protein [Kutzneria albida]|uniref:AMP-dependent acetyl-coenzyme A synthetase and ligase n=1 Tax=Kutzneria albida DSM 43870 TaxID=1449976 RepID=W5W6J2_9PSEU|nr:AMP-binding protein [Kutzneria albida]AHH96813.1 AMP-dependent acetyl-coenzyme A synthetase and ligase [Kutzneria albida DSM 43870]